MARYALALHQQLGELATCRAEIAALRSSRTWRVGHAIARRLPGYLLRRLARRAYRLLGRT